MVSKIVNKYLFIVIKKTKMYVVRLTLLNYKNILSVQIMISSKSVISFLWITNIILFIYRYFDNFSLFIFVSYTSKMHKKSNAEFNTNKAILN